jgi:hypothetical protein
MATSLLVRRDGGYGSDRWTKERLTQTARLK